MRGWFLVPALALAACDGYVAIVYSPIGDLKSRDHSQGIDGSVADVSTAPDVAGSDRAGVDRTGTDSARADSTRADSALAPCQEIPGMTYQSLAIEGSPTDRPPAQHADLNVELRGWQPTGGTLGLIDLNGDTDTGAPKLYTLFADDRTPTFVRNYQVYDWDWGCNCRGALVTDWETTLSGMAVAPGEIIQCPRSDYNIGADNTALVLFVDDNSITLKYTANDNVVHGYTIHLVGVCVEPSLRARYDANRAAGSTELPALRGDQSLGRARGSELIVAIRDTGAFMDPRSRKDWW